jgi:DNA repair exonuclease SbcCD ATPase subunit
MKITKVEWRNFFSYGNRKQTLEFPDSHSLIQVVGGNGNGKSSISQIITFVLYGKVDGKKLKDLPNRINGNAWARIEMQTQLGQVSVERGLEPNHFKLFLNGNEYDQAGKKSIQDYLTDDILGIPFYVFNNTILLSVNDFKSFIKMGVQDKRAIIDKIFGFQILNQMREVLKDENKKIKEKLDNLSGKSSTVQRSLEKSLAELERASEELAEASNNKTQELTGSLDKFISLQELHRGKINEFRTIETSTNSGFNECNRKVIETRLEISSQKKRLQLYSQDKCPTCHSDLSSDFHASVKQGISELLSGLESELSESENLLSQWESEQRKNTEMRNSLAEKGQKISLKIQSIRNEINSTQPTTDNIQLSALQRIVEDLEIEKNSVDSEKVSVGEKSIWLKTLDEILGEKGVKQLAIRTILPSLNSQIQELLLEMNLAYQVVFDEEFNASLYHMGIEIGVASLSTGEMKKVDFSVLVAIVKLMKIKFSGINLLFLDEIFSSVDPEGVHSILKILTNSAKELGLNIFVINHAPMPNEIFDYNLEVSKVNSFSTISLNKL